MKPTYLLLFLLGLCGACGAQSYLLDPVDYARVSQNPEARQASLPASAEPSQALVYVNPQKLKLDRAEPLPDSRLRVKPRRPSGLFIGGSISLGIGAVLLSAGLGSLLRPCPPTAFCEGGWLIEPTLMGIGSVNIIVGGIQLMVGAARWSPETGRPAS